MGLGDLTLIDELFEYVTEGRLDLTKLITHTMSLDEILEAFDLFNTKPDKTLKIIIKP